MQPGYNPYAAAWVETILSDGRRYYYNASTGVSTWERPAEYVASMGTSLPAPMQTTTISAPAPSRPISNADVAASWRELQNQQGRKYYYNTVTKATVWEMPTEYKDYLEKQSDAPPKPIDKDQGEAQFMAMLREKNISSRLSWEEALREIINHPHYKSIPTLAERKAAFLRYCEMRREGEREERLQRAINAKEAFRNALDADDRIDPEMRWMDVLPLVKDTEAFRAVNSVRECAEIYDRWQEEAVRRKREEERMARRQGMTRLRDMLREMPMDLSEAKWQTILPRLQAHKDFSSLNLKPIDMLDVWEEHLREIEGRQPQKDKLRVVRERRTERMHRITFQELLEGLVARGKMHALSSWPEIWAQVKDHPSYQALIVPRYAPPASALLLYLDRLDKLQQAYLTDRRLIVSMINTEVVLSEEQVRGLLRAHPDYHLIKDKTHISCYLMEREMYSRLVEPPDAAEVRGDKLLLRKRVEAYKHLLKHCTEPTILPHSRWSEIRPQLRKHNEFIELPDEEFRHNYFEKYLAYLRKKCNAEDLLPRVEEGEIVEIIN